MKQKIGAIAVVSAVLAGTGAMARTPSAYGDSDAAVLDTRIGSVAAATESALDSRTGSQDVSNLRGLNTTKMGTNLIIR